MKEIDKNTVSGDGQMINSSEISFLGNKAAKRKILVLGNSITRHGPLKEIGWERDWGMAASSPDKDYVHRLYSLFVGNGENICMYIRQAAVWEIRFLEKDILSKFEAEKNFKADIIIFRLGENVPRENAAFFIDALKKFIDFLADKNTKIIFTTCFWYNEDIDYGIRSVANEYGSALVELGDLGEDPEMKAWGLFWHGGVANHPGDKGMEKIAERIFEAI